MDGCDIALVGVSGGWDALVWGAAGGDGAGEAVGLEFADELAAVIGLPGPVAESDAAALPRGWDALGKALPGAFAAALCEG